MTNCFPFYFLIFPPRCISFSSPFIKLISAIRIFGALSQVWLSGFNCYKIKQYCHRCYVTRLYYHHSLDCSTFNCTTLHYTELLCTTVHSTELNICQLCDLLIVNYTFWVLDSPYRETKKGTVSFLIILTNIITGKKCVKWIHTYFHKLNVPIKVIFLGCSNLGTYKFSPQSIHGYDHEVWDWL